MNNLDQMADQINKFADAVDKASDDLKKKESEDLKNPNAMKMYHDILAGSMELVKNSTVQETFNYFGDRIGRDFSSKLMELLILIMTHSAFNATVIYNEQLMTTMEKRDKEIYEILNRLLADSQGHDMAIKQIREKIGASFK